MTGPWLVAVSAGRWQLSGIAAVKAEGARVLALDGDPAAPGLRLAHRAAVVDITDPDRVVAAVRDAGIEPAAAVAFVSEVGMLAAAAVREAWALPGPDRGLTTLLTDKSAQRALWTERGVPCPRWRLLERPEEAAAAALELGPTVVVKPVDSSGSRGVTVARSAEACVEAARRALSFSRRRRFLVESHLQGTEYTVETFGDGRTTHVLAVTSKRKVPGTDDTVASELATIADERAELLGRTTVLALETLGHRAGPGHTELIMGADGRPFLVESAGRAGGFMVADGLVPRAAGLDLARATVRLALGRSMPARGARQAVILRFVPTRAGVLRELAGFEEARALEGVDAGPLLEVGAALGAARADGDRVAYVLAWADDPREARSRADRAEGLLRIRVDEAAHG